MPYGAGLPVVIYKRLFVPGVVDFVYVCPSIHWIELTNSICVNFEINSVYAHFKFKLIAISYIMRVYTVYETTNLHSESLRLRTMPQLEF